jgi:hypothetical protein
VVRRVRSGIGCEAVYHFSLKTQRLMWLSAPLLVTAELWGFAMLTAVSVPERKLPSLPLSCQQHILQTIFCKHCTAGFLNNKAKKQQSSKTGYSNAGVGQREEGPAAAARAREQQQQHPYGRSRAGAAGMAGMTPDESAAFLHPGSAGAGSSAAAAAAAAGQPARKVRAGSVLPVVKLHCLMQQWAIVAAARGLKSV